MPSTDSAIRITVNGDPLDLPAGRTLSELIGQLNLIPERVAIEVNRDLVRRASFATHRINAGDEIEIVTLVGGG